MKKYWLTLMGLFISQFVAFAGEADLKVPDIKQAPEITISY